VFAEMVGTDDQYAFAFDWDRYMIHLEKGRARFENRAVGVYRMEVGMWTGLSDFERTLWGPRARLSHWRYFGYRHPEFFLSQAVAMSDRCLEIMRDAGTDPNTEIVVKQEHVADLRDVVEECRSHLASLTYDPAFFARNREGSARSAEAILSLAFDLIRPASVIDVGCGIGVWLAVASRLGARRVLGIDGPWVPRDALLIPAESFLEHDLETRVPRQRRFDLAVCVEVAEHLDPARGDSLVEDLCELADVVLFSAAIPGQGGDAHHNEQWPSYWRDRFARRKYALVDCFRPQLWDDDQVEWWYAQNTFLYVNADRLTADQRLQAAVAESPQMLLSVVHPRLFEKYSPPWAPPDPEPPHQGST
jgi:SAM-dependent methyltransferase